MATTERKTITDLMPNLLDGQGIFGALATYDVPWADTSTTTTTLDAMYYAHSANKLLSPASAKLLDAKEYAEYMPMLAALVWALYSDKWQRIWDTLALEYAPIENYLMTETTTETGTDERSATDGGTLTDNGSTSTGNGVYGFDSSSAVPSDTTDGTSTNTTTRNLTHGESGEHAIETQRTRRGNIGVTTSQQMAQSEIDLRQYVYFENVIEDIDSVLTLCVY